MASSVSCSYLSETDSISFLKNSNLSILHINVRSLNANFLSFYSYIETLCVKPTIIAITETWLKPHNETLFPLNGYNFIAVSRKDKLGGGVGLYICDNLHYNIRADLTSSTSFECLFVEICRPNLANMVIGCIYKPPNSDIDNFNFDLELLLVKLKAKNKFCAIAGDFNIDLQDVNCHVKDCMNVWSSNSFFPTVNLPTRVTNTCSTVIDNIFINNDLLNNLSAVVYSDISDHYPILLQLPLSTAIPEINNSINKRRIFDTNSTNKFNSALLTQDWSEVAELSVNNPEQAYNRFNNIFFSLVDTYFPLRAFKCGRNYPRKEWMTKGLVKCCNRKSVLFKKYRLSSTIDNEHKYISYRNRLKTILLKAEKDYYGNKFESLKNNSAGTWRLIKQVMGNKKSVNAFSAFKTKPQETAEEFNEFFSEIGSNLAGKIVSTSSFDKSLHGEFINSFALLPTTVNEVLNIVHDLNGNASPGYDELPVSTLKLCIHTIAPILSLLINSSFDHGYFPCELKKAKVTPIFKSGAADLVSNYRPISVLPSLSKVYEKAMHNRLYNYVCSNNILIPNQYGFRNAHSVYMAHLDLHYTVATAIENGLFQLVSF